MEMSWGHTREALRNFTDALKCESCGKEPIGATRYSNCGHIFCKGCISNNSKCKCGTPARPTEVRSDEMVAGLTHCCNIIAEVIKNKNPWNETGKAHDLPLRSPVKNQMSMPGVTLNLKRNINKRNPKGETALHSACLKNQDDRARILLTAGADPNTKDNANWTPLQEVVNLGYTDICRLLLEAGALPNVPGVDNRTALHEAVISNRFEEAKILLLYNASKEVYDQHGKKPLDYCSTLEMQEILVEKEELEISAKDIGDMHRTLDKTLSTIGQSQFIVLGSNLKTEAQASLSQVAVKHKMKIVENFRSTVTHVILEANDRNIVNLTYNVMMAILRGCWLLNSEWISLCKDLEDISEIDLEIFEVAGAPEIGTPKRSRENKRNQNPGLFDRCYFYFAMQAKASYYIGDMELTKDTLVKLVTEGDGNILTREPDPENIKGGGALIPFHTAHDSQNSLYKCTHYIVYVPDNDEPRVKYNMPHVKSLPLMWLIECVEKFALVDPIHLGLL